MFIGKPVIPWTKYEQLIIGRPIQRKDVHRKTNHAMTIIWPTVLPMIVFLWMGIPIISCSYIHAARGKVITFLFLFLWLRLCISMSSLGKGWLPGSPKPWIVTLPLSTCLATCIVFVMIELVVLFNLIAISQPTQVPGNDSQCYFDLGFLRCIWC